MIHQRGFAIVVGIPLLFLVGALVVAEPGQKAASEKPNAEGRADPVHDNEFDSKVATFMRRKLGASGEVLEGLVTEDFEMIAKGAKTMEAMSRASDWQMIKGPLYIQFSNEFRKVCEDLAEAAREKNVDAAGLDYMRLTMGCISCHNYVRKTMMADSLDARSLDFAGRR